MTSEKHSSMVRLLPGLLWCGLVVCGTCLGQQSGAEIPVPQLSQRPAPAPDFSHARRLMQEGKVEEAIAELRALETTAPATKVLDLELGTAYYKKSDYVKAIASLKKAVTADPGN